MLQTTRRAILPFRFVTTNGKRDLTRCQLVSIAAFFICHGVWCDCVAAQINAEEPSKIEFFEKAIRPLLVRHCYECHSGASNEIKGGLRLDYRGAVLQGGESGPAVKPGNPGESLLLKAVRHEGLEMPPGKKLSDAEISHLTEWVTSGAVDPREHPPEMTQVAEETFESLYQDRRNWWSLKPVQLFEPPHVAESEGMSEIDLFIVDALRKQGLDLAPAADPGSLARRAFFAVTGLPPTEAQITEFLNAPAAAESWDHLVDTLLDSPHFGERWARHWMDVVRYTDTYGYEWDMPAKGAWRFRDYLIRAFNEDVPFDQFVREQLAGDLMKSPRRNHSLCINESLIGPMFYQMGEKRHGDSSEFNGIHQEMLDNKIDAFGKTFLATTVACARCHDHKLDAISQRDYYALGGMFISARWVTNTVDLPERNATAVAQLEHGKEQLRREISRRWINDVESLDSGNLNERDNERKERPIEDPLHVWNQIQTAVVAGQSVHDVWPVLKQKYQAENQRRVKENAAHFTLVADFRDGIPAGWSVDGEGLRQVVPRGDFVVALTGDKVVESVLLGGLCTNSVSPRMNGALRSPWTKTLAPGHLSFEAAGGDFAARRVVVDNAFLTEKQQYLADPLPQWQLVDGMSSLQDRNIYVEFATKTSNPNFPPRVGLGGACSEEQAADPRSWFQISRVVKHVAPFTPLDEMSQILPLFDGDLPQSVDDVASRYRALMANTISMWATSRCRDDDVKLLNWMLSEKILSNELVTKSDPDKATESASSESLVHRLVERYRQQETQLQEAETVNGMADVDQLHDYPLNIRGDYDNPGAAVPHGSPRFLADTCGHVASEHNRLELAEMVASRQNPLTARVYVNRVWHWLFGRGLVTTTDDFGHVGDQPSHPELLDYLAVRFMNEGWSTKRLVRSILLSRTWQQSQQAVPGALEADPANRLLHHFPVQRLDAESLRDAILFVSGRIDATLYGPTLNPSRLNEDPQKRLFSGPLDGLGRRSIYTKVTIMEPPRFLATFNQPSPKIPTGRRDITTTPAQSLTLLNDPFVMNQAEFWATQLVSRQDGSVEARVQHMFAKALGRDATSEELSRWSDASRDFAAAPSTTDAERLADRNVWQAMAHAMFNTKEFLYLR